MEEGSRLLPAPSAEDGQAESVVHVTRRSQRKSEASAYNPGKSWEHRSGSSGSGKPNNSRLGQEGCRAGRTAGRPAPPPRDTVLVQPCPDYREKAHPTSSVPPTPGCANERAAQLKVGTDAEASQLVAARLRGADSRRHPPRSPWTRVGGSLSETVIRWSLLVPTSPTLLWKTFYLPN